ncbi:hypothetical protein MMC22_009740 [Lobaria immixta]|nr:hypothetical protein [Lobaria immixta]
MTKLLDFVLNEGEQFRRARLPSLYSDFSLQRYTNPDGYAANIAAWEDILIKANGEGLIPAGPDGRDFLSLRTGEELLQSLETREWGRPLALGIVIDEAVSRQHLIPVKDFLQNTSSIYDQGWFVRPRRLISWGFRQLGATGRTSTSMKLPVARYVIVEVVEIVKFSASNESPSPISTEDRTIASLRSLISDLNLQVDRLTSQSAALAAQAKTAIEKRNRPQALRALRSKKMAEDNLTQRLETLSTLEGISAKIEQASDQIAIVRAIKNSTGVLRSLNAQVGEIEKVEDIMEELQQEMKSVDQVSEIIEDAGRDPAVDDDAIDEELTNLIRAEDEKKEEQETREKLATIDAVPSTSSGSQIIAELERPSSTAPDERGDSPVTDAFVRMSLDEKKDPVVESDDGTQRSPIAEG